MKLVNDKGQEVKPGDIVRDSRGDVWKVISVEEPRHSGSTGRVHVKLQDTERHWQQGFYPGVFQMKWEGRQD